MNYCNYHTHSNFCDGHGELEEYVKKALDYGFKTIGFTSHAPLPMDNIWTMKVFEVQNYIDTVNSLKTKYCDMIQIYLGMEVDYFSQHFAPVFDYKSLNLDYIIGAIHVITHPEKKEFFYTDESDEELVDGVNSIFKGSFRLAVSTYYNYVRNMIHTIKPDIIAHIDLMKKNNEGEKYFSEDEKWYRDEVLRTLDSVARSNCIIEVNTGGRSRGFISSFYPSTWILKECKRMNIPIIINSDAHNPENINAYFDEAVSLVKDIGYKKQRVLYNNQWIDIML